MFRTRIVFIIVIRKLCRLKLLMESLMLNMVVS